MKTTLNLNEHLIGEAVKLTGKSNKTEIINEALMEYIRTIKRESLIGLFGKGIIDDSFSVNDYRETSCDR
ncbi:MAG TPA: hypothetical protein DD381_11115 [Lentisphaeria bacterium]|nr:MAG: hypothetical protein A2X47_00485 [Lentisphaerae bacterium GWF2_38_69]HBM16878.1 hypothetical protein [Lentisphaeria bacterium]